MNENGARSDVDRQRPGPREMLRTLGTCNLQREAAERGMGLSAYLEAVDPSSEYNDGTDAFGRLLREAGIVVNGDWARGFPASEFGEFNRDANTRALFVEFATRVWRRTITGCEQSTRSLAAGQRELVTSDMEAINTFLRPYTDSTLRPPVLTPAIPVAELVALNTGIDGNAYRITYLDAPAAAQTRFVRIGESAEIPKAVITTSQRTLNLYKFGRAIEASYEALRRERVDKIAFWIAMAAAQADVDRLAAALDVLINGDGGPSTAATSYNLTALDAAATVGSLTTKAWLAWKLKWLNPYALTTTLEQEDVTLQMMLLNMGSANVPLVSLQGSAGFGSLEPINVNLRDAVRFGKTGDAPASKIVGFDRRTSLERIFEVGSTVRETERYITNQTQVLTMTENEGFASLQPAGVKILNLGA